MYCPNCGTEIARKSKECQFCGITVGWEEPGKSNPEPVRRKRARPQLDDEYLSSSLVMPRLPDDDDDEGDMAEAAETKMKAERQVVYKPKGFHVFEARGRINRLKLAYSWLLDNLALLLLGYVYLGSFFVPWAVFASALLIMVPAFLAMAKRFHDIGKRGYSVIHLAIPFYNIFILIALLFFEPEEKGEEYGAYDGNEFYWQYPLVVLAVPALICAVFLLLK